MHFDRGGIRPEAMFEYIIGFAQYYRVIAPWIPEELNELEDVVAGLILVMRHEGVKRAHFAGMSFGGIVAHVRPHLDRINADAC